MGFEITLEELAVKLGGSVAGEKRLSIRELSIDSRTLVPSPEILFVALSGEQHDGHDYIRELCDRGQRAFLVSRLPAGHLPAGTGFCLVPDTLVGLQELAALRRQAFQGTVAAVTGSNGKTIVKEWIFQLLGEQFRIHRSPKSYNSQVGVPLSVWMTGPSDQLALIEAGISRPGEMERLQHIIRPQIGILTNLGGAHQENFNSLEQKLEEKLKLFKGCDRIICRADQHLGERSVVSFLEPLGAKLIDWSLDGEATYRYHMEGRSTDGTHISTRISGERMTFHLPFSDDASVENALQALTFSLETGLPPSQAAERISNLEPVSMRLEILQGDQGSILINDAYNSDTKGISAALDLMERQEKKSGRVVILSDLLQSGKNDRELYGEIAGLMVDKGIEQFIGVGPALMHQRDLFPDQALFFSDTTEFLGRVDRTLFRERIILVKGSRRFGFERITAELQLKSHQTLLEIDLNAMVHNLNLFRSRVDEGVKTMVMVKALSYGSGHVEIASLLQFHQVDYLAVAFIDEGIELRKAGIHLPIMVLNPDPAGFDPMLDYQLEPEIFSMRILEALFRKLRYRTIQHYPIHLKIDTGMHRLGFQEEELGELLPWLRHDEFHLNSVFSHLAASDEPVHDAFTNQQIERFERISDRIRRSLGVEFQRHLLNSSGIERFPRAQYEMVRLGIGLHGIGSPPDLEPVSTFRTTISQIRKVEEGETVGYSRRGKVSRKSTIATLPVGYADGFHRNLGNGTGKVWINGRSAPVIGNICMDMTMVDITDVEASEGDPVEIFGRYQSVTELALQAGTIPYEILASIPERVKRVYLYE